MGLGAFNRMRQVKKMKAENVNKEQENKQEKKPDVVKTPVEQKQEEKPTLGPRKRKQNKE